MAKYPSRPKRWADAVARARAAADELEQAYADLDEVRQEYADWRDNFPENAQSGETYQKLEAVADLDFDFGNIDLSALDEAEGADLPLGFGRD